MKARADYNYTILANATGIDTACLPIFIRDLNCGSVSVTNDAEAVIDDIHADLLAIGASGIQGRIVLYRDSDGRIDRIAVNGQGRFHGFRPAPRDLLVQLGFLAPEQPKPPVKAVTFTWELLVTDDDGAVVDTHTDASLMQLASMAETMCLLDDTNRIELVRRVGGYENGRFPLVDGQLQPDADGNVAPLGYRHQVSRVARRLGLAG